MNKNLKVSQRGFIYEFPKMIFFDCFIMQISGP